MSDLLPPVVTDRYTLVHADCVPTLAATPEGSVALCVTSIPFANLFAYTRDEADLGNNRPESFWYGFRCVAEAQTSLFAESAPSAKPRARRGRAA